ncbi:protein slender lobes [Eurosta solidaginis]|uniref:protein slender lobes n=1 Tax=Eurosta solidaginis TaxID=178769 RepID=UPI003530CBD8
MDSLDDVSSGGRVTRSLRKRLTSVDSIDTGSRPSTPQLTKLTSIPESSSPSRSLRMTRRNSTTGNGTPLKVLPKSKTSISDIQSTENSPARRTTRRSSISTLSTPNKVNQEDEATNIITKRRAARLQSKSPPQEDDKKRIDHVSPKKNKTGTKSRRNILSNEESDSDVEIINLEEKDEEGEKNVSPKIEEMEKRTLNSSNENIEIIDLSDETLVTDDVEKSVKSNMHKEKMESEITEEVSLKSYEMEQNNADTLHPAPIRQRSNERDDSMAKSSDSVTKKNNKEVLDANEDALHLDGEVLKGSHILRSPEKSTSPLKNISNISPCESFVNNNFKPKEENKAGETALAPVEIIDLMGDVLVKQVEEKEEDVSLQTGKIEPFKLGEKEENNIESSYPKAICMTKKENDDITTAQPDSPQKDSIEKLNNGENFDRQEDALHLELSEVDNDLKDSNIVKTSEKLASNNFTFKTGDKGEDVKAISKINAIETMDFSDGMLMNDGKVETENLNLENCIENTKPMEKEANIIPPSDIPYLNSRENTDKEKLSGSDDVSSTDNFISPPRNKTTVSLVESVIMLQKLSPKVIARLCDENNILSPKNSKSVTFQNNNLEDDDVAKSSYPKTPASIKCKNYISKDCSKNYEDNMISFDNPSTDSEEVSANQSKESASANDPSEVHFGDNVDMGQDYTPHKPKNPMVLQSSTPVCDSVLPSNQMPLEPATITASVIDHAENSQIESARKTEEATTADISERVELTIAEHNEGSTTNEDEANKHTSSVLHHQPLDLPFTTDNIDASSATERTKSNSGIKKKENENDDTFSKSWTHNVNVCATSDHKIDIIADNSSINQQHQDPDSKDINVIVKEKTSPKLSEGNTGDMECEWSNDSFQKLEFVDDEAMEAPDDYQSGDSIDEDARKEIEENEILEDGESIGSEDTISDGSNEGDDDNASFVTSDSDGSLLEYSDEDEDMEDISKKGNTKKPNSHILSTSESEDNELSQLNEGKLTNGITKKNKNNLSNQRKGILASSESENDEPTIKFKEENGNTLNNSKYAKKPLNFDVTKMIDASTDDEININETLPQEQNVNSKNKHLNNSKEILNTNKGFKADCTSDSNYKLLDCESKSESLNKVVRRSNNKTCDVELEVTNGTELNVLNVSTTIKSTNIPSVVSTTMNNSKKNTNRKSLLLPINQNKNKDSGDVAEASSINVDGKETDQTQSTPAPSMQEALNSNNESFMSTKSAAGTVIDDNKDDVYEFKECENVVPQSENEYSETERDNEGEDVEIPETQEVQNIDNGTHHDESTVDEESVAGTDSIITGSVSLKNVGWSASFCEAKYKRNDFKLNKTRHHRSFTIGVSLMKTGVEEIEPSNFLGVESSDSSQTNSIDSVSGNEGQLDREEVEKLEMLKHNLQFPCVKKNRQSLNANDAHDTEEKIRPTKTKRKSMQLLIKEKFNPSKSLIESIESRKRELDSIKEKKSRLSKSFCETLNVESNGLSENNTSSNSSDKSEDEDVKKGSTRRNLNTFKNSKRDYCGILERCDQILEAANRAKLESKQNFKKSKVKTKRPKKSSKQSASSGEEPVNHASIATKDIKHLKEKSTVALEQALRASAKILMNEARKIKSPQQISGEHFGDRRLPTEILNAVSDQGSKTKLAKKKCKNKSPVFQRLNCASGEVIEEVLAPKKKKRDIFNKIELPTGVVLEEPVTPTKKPSASGFHESSITPRNLGFKVRHILFAGQDKVPELRRASHNVVQKRKRKIVDPEHILPKPQWSQSGVFIEEILPSSNDKKRLKLHSSACRSVDNSSTLNALNFKNSTMLRKNVLRESSHELLQRKERQCIKRNHF